MKNKIILTIGMIALVVSTVSCQNLGNGKIDLPQLGLEELIGIQQIFS